MSLNPEALRTGGAQDYPEYLLQANQVATDENVGLFQAANKGNLSECERFLKRGAKPNFFFRPDDQKNALHVAAEHDFADIVKLLLHHGAEVNSIATSDQSSALTLAAHNDNPTLIKILLDAGAAIDHGTVLLLPHLVRLTTAKPLPFLYLTENGYGNTALHEACRAGSAATILCLLQNGADVNAKNHKGSSPLHTYCYGDADKRAAGECLCLAVTVMLATIVLLDGHYVRVFQLFLPHYDIVERCI